MLNDLLVSLSAGTERDPAAHFALSIAESFAAHIKAVAYALKPVVGGNGVSGIDTAILSANVKEEETAAQEALHRFQEDAWKYGVGFDTKIISDMLTDAADRFGRMARSFDLSVVSQCRPDQLNYDDLFIESALLNSGRPVIVVPYIHKTPIKYDRMICCWDGSQHAARAIADAMPFLERAGKIDLLTVKTAKNDQAGIPVTDIAMHLARKKLDVSIEQIVAPEIQFADVVMNHAADNRADLLVMGGYGHSRWREFVLGGATRGVLSSMTVPTLMAH